MDSPSLPALVAQVAVIFFVVITFDAYKLDVDVPRPQRWGTAVYWIYRVVGNYLGVLIVWSVVLVALGGIGAAAPWYFVAVGLGGVAMFAALSARLETMRKHVRALPAIRPSDEVEKPLRADEWAGRRLASAGIVAVAGAATGTAIVALFALRNGLPRRSYR